MPPAPTRKFYNGIKVPIVGLGTNGMSVSITKCTIMDAIDIGYRHIDSAPIFCNELEVGLGIQEKIKEGVVTRKDLYVSSKLWNSRHSKRSVRTACEETLKILKLDYLDNYVMHMPVAFQDGSNFYPRDTRNNIIFADTDYLETWAAMEALVDAGLCRSIGVANFNINQLKRLLETARIKPANLQIESHPFLTQKELMSFCCEQDIMVMPFGTLGSNRTIAEANSKDKLINHPTVKVIALKLRKEPAQILLRYQIQLGNVPVVMSMNKQHLISNIESYSFRLSKQEMSELDSMNSNYRLEFLDIASGHPHHPFENECF